jgi:phage-related protein
MLIYGIIDAIPQLVESIPEIIVAIVEALEKAIPKLLEVGKHLVEGLWNGLLQAKDWLFNKVKEFAQGILDSIKSALGIASPSKVFQDEVGTNIALGVGEGFSKSMKSVAEDMSDIMYDLSTTMTNEISIGDIPKTTPRITHENNYITKNYQNTTETIRQSSPVILQVNDKELGRVIVPIYDREKTRMGVSGAT